jgi:hypothetical protein
MCEMHILVRSQSENLKRRDQLGHMVTKISVVDIETGYGLDDRGVEFRVPVEPRILSSPRCSDRFWGPLSLLSNGYRGLFPPGGKAADALS